MTTPRSLTIAALTVAASTQLLAGDFSYSGFFSNGYLQSDDNNYLVDSEDGSFEFVEAAINATWTPIERTAVKGQLFTFELGEYGNYEPLIDYLFVDYNVNPAFGLRVGRVKRSVGLYTDIQDVDIARTSILLPVGMYDQRYRDFSASIDGLSLYGSISTGVLSSVDYIAFHGMADFNTDGGFAGAALTSIGRQIADAQINAVDVDSNSGLQLWWNTPVSGLRVGANYSHYSDIIVNTEGTIPFLGYPIQIDTVAQVDQTTLSAEYYLGDWTLSGEFLNQEARSESRQTVAGMAGGWAPSESTSRAWYLSAARRFLDKFEGGLTYAVYHDDVDDKDNPLMYQKDVQLSLRYDATEFWTLKAELHFMDGTSRVFNHLGQNPDRSDDWTLFAAKSTFAF